jgi:hypothetical protein
MVELTDLGQAKRGMAIIAACIVDALAVTDPTFKDRFVRNLDRAYSRVRNERASDRGNDLHDLEMIGWTHELVTGISRNAGQGKPWLDQK